MGSNRGWVSLAYLLVISKGISKLPLYTIGKGFCLFCFSFSKQKDCLRVKWIGKYWLLTDMWNVTALTPGQEMVDAVWKVVVSSILFMASPGDGLFRSLYRGAHVSKPFKGNAGQPLFLSPYIRAGKIKEGKFDKCSMVF